MDSVSTPAAAVPPSIVPARDESGFVRIPSAQYLDLLRKYDNAGGLSSYVLGVLSVGKFDKKVAQTIRDKCSEYLIDAKGRLLS